MRQPPGVIGLAALQLASFMMYAFRLHASRWSATKGRATLPGMGLTSCHGDKNCVKYDYRFLNFKTGNRQTGNRLTTLLQMLPKQLLAVLLVHSKIVDHQRTLSSCSTSRTISSESFHMQVAHCTSLAVIIEFVALAANQCKLVVITHRARTT